MRYRFSRVLAGILVMMLVVSSGSSTVFAGTNQRFAATGVVGIGEPGNARATGQMEQRRPRIQQQDSLPGILRLREDSLPATARLEKHSLPVATHL